MTPFLHVRVVVGGKRFISTMDDCDLNGRCVLKAAEDRGVPYRVGQGLRSTTSRVPSGETLLRSMGG